MEISDKDKNRCIAFIATLADEGRTVREAHSIVSFLYQMVAGRKAVAEYLHTEKIYARPVKELLNEYPELSKDFSDFHTIGFDLLRREGARQNPDIKQQ